MAWAIFRILVGPAEDMALPMPAGCPTPLASTTFIYYHNLPMKPSDGASPQPSPCYSTQNQDDTPHPCSLPSAPPRAISPPSPYPHPPVTQTTKHPKTRRQPVSPFSAEPPLSSLFLAASAPPRGRSSRETSGSASDPAGVDVLRHHATRKEGRRMTQGRIHSHLSCGQF